MWHLAPFAAGVIAGAVALRLLKAGKTGTGLEKAQDRLRDATVSGLQAIESASARTRARLGERADGAEAATEAGATAAAAAPAEGGDDDRGARRRAKVAPRRRKAGGTKERA